MNNFRSNRLSCIIVMLLFSAGNVLGQVSGRAVISSGFDDFPPAGVGNMPVKAYVYNAKSGLEELWGEAITDEQGNYQLPVPGGTRVRVVFDDSKTGMFPSAKTPSVRYVQSPRNDVDWVGNGAVSKTAHAYAVAPVYINGAGNDSTYALVAASLSGDEPVQIKQLARSGLTGALWGVAYDRKHGQLYSSAFAKRHAGYGRLGTGGIYRTDWKSGKTVAYLDLQSLGIMTGADKHTGLLQDQQSKSRDSLFINEVGKVSLGGMDMAPDGSLYIMNLADRSLYRLRIPSDTTQRPGRSDVRGFKVPVARCKGGQCRPFAVKVHQGGVYIGAVCDAGFSGKRSDLKALVYRLDVQSGDFELVFSTGLDYRRGEGIKGFGNSGWNGWSDDFSRSLNPDFPSLASYPQPILSSIAFDEDGSMILGLMDRFGHLSGVGQPDPAGKIAVSGVASGDLLRVSREEVNTFSGRRYKLESDGAAGRLSTAGRGNLQGPSGGEFYFADGFYEKKSEKLVRVVHEETGSGAVAMLPGMREVLSTAHEPGETFNTGGIRSYYTTDGGHTRSIDFFENGQSGTFGKANGVGGLEVVSEGAGITLGSRVWLDVNGNGVQDIEEPGLGNIPVELWRDGILLARTYSDKDGVYGFIQENVPSGIIPHAAYQVKVPLESLGMGVTLKAVPGSETERDNDAVPDNEYATIQLTTEEATTSRFYDIGLTATGVLAEHPGEKVQVTVYPNPVTENIKIKFNAPISSAILSIVDMGGRRMNMQRVASRSGKYDVVFSVVDWPSGNYIVRIQDADSHCISAICFVKY